MRRSITFFILLKGFFLSYDFWQYFSYHHSVDLVYTWVNGSDPEWITEQRHWLRESKKLQLESTDSSRFIPHDELKYSLRSVYYYAPWIRTIYLISNGQTPTWLDTTHAKIRIIEHKRIMPENSIPTFNSEAIEANIQKVPGLSEFFLYANDDFFIGRKLTPHYFFTLCGKPRYRIGIPDIRKVSYKRCLYTESLMFTANLFAEKFHVLYPFEPSHNICPYRRSLYTKVAEVSTQRAIVTYYSVHFHQAVIVHHHREIYTSIDHPQQLNKLIHSQKPTLFCINDNPSCAPENRCLLSNYLHSLFPKPAPWEKP